MAGLLCAAGRPYAAEFFYLDHDALTGVYAGPVGPLVLSGDIEPGDRARLLARISEDVERFLSRNALILASTDGDVGEALRIADLLRSLDTEVTVGPVTGPCAGPCFLLYAAAARRGTAGSQLLGFSPPLSEAVRSWLLDDGMPADLLDSLASHPPSAVYWLSGAEEARLGTQSPAFARSLAARCRWNDAAERDALAGRRSFRELEPLWSCRDHLTRAAARDALGRLLHPAAAIRH